MAIAKKMLTMQTSRLSTPHLHRLIVTRVTRFHYVAGTQTIVIPWVLRPPQSPASLIHYDISPYSKSWTPANRESLSEADKRI